MVDLEDYLDDAVWTSNRLVSDNSGDDDVRLDWGGGRGDPAGFVNMWPNALSEAGDRSDFLVTRPRPGPRGSVRGLFPFVTMPPAAEFRCRVGFLEGTSDSSGAVFQLRVHYQYESRALSHRVFSMYKERDGSLTDVQVDLSFLAGREARLELRVDVGRRPDASDLPVWDSPQVVERELALAVPTRYFQVRPIALTVNSRTEASGGGDEPFLGVIYFRTSVGVPGSTMVEVLDLLQTLGDDLDSGTSIPIGDGAAMVVRDIGMQSGMLATIMGTIFVALEEDKFGRETIRDVLRTTANRIAFFLTETAENDSMSVISDPDAFVRALQRAAAGEDPNADGTDPDVSIHNAIKQTLKRIGVWFGRAHDLIGVNAISLVVGPLAEIVLDAAGSSTSRVFPVSRLENREFALDYGGGSWTLRVEVQVVEPATTLSGNPTLATTDRLEVG